MYSTDSITALSRRGHWAPPIPPTSKILTTENATSTSGRLFTSFHALCTVENVEGTMPISNAASGLDELVSNEQLNAKLSEIRTQAAIKVLNRVFTNNPLAQYRYNGLGYRVDNSGYDWSVSITTRIANLDDCFGYQVAYDVMQMMLTTQRLNGRERSIAQAGEISAQMQGYRRGDNVFVDGVLQKLEDAYATAIGLFFESQTNRRVFNGSHSW